AHGLKPEHLLVPKDEWYLQYADVVADRRYLRHLVESDPGVVAAEVAVQAAIERWWKYEEPRFDKLQSAADLVDLRKELIGAFRSALQATPLLDHFAVSGIVASWWGASLPDLKALANLGYKGLVEAWVATVLDALEEEKAKVDPLGHKVAEALLPEYLDQLAVLEAEVADLDSTIKAAGASDDDDDAEPADGALSPAELKKLKSKLTATKKRLKSEKAAFADRLAAASTALDDTSARHMVLDALEHDLLAEANDRISRHRRAVISTFETWWDKYQTPLSTLEAERDAAAAKLAGFLKELGYE
ncbi:MAG: SAM-dependent DNA methyltransferase, partial [Bradyrhizobium icense]